MKRLPQALIYGVFGSIFVPLASVILLLPVLLVLLGISFLPPLGTVISTSPVSIVNVPFIHFSASTSSSWVLPAFGALIFALGGALMRPDGDKKFDDVRLLPRFYRQVFIWMLRSAAVCGVWGAILGAFAIGRSVDYLSGAALGLVGGTLGGEMVGLVIGAARSALHRDREA